MKKYLAGFALGAVLFGTFGVFAAFEKGGKATNFEAPSTPVIDGQTIATACTNETTDSPGCRCAVIETSGHSQVWLTILFTKAAATRVDLEVYTKHDVANAWGKLQSGPTSALPAIAMGNHDPYWDTSAVSGTVGWSTGFDVVAPWMRFCFVGTAATTDDVDVYAGLY